MGIKKIASHVHVYRKNIRNFESQTAVAKYVYYVINLTICSVVLTEKRCAYCEVWIETLNKFQASFESWKIYVTWLLAKVND